MQKTPAKIEIPQLKEAIKIIELARSLGVEVDAKNRAVCMFHNEKTPSLNFSDEKGIFKCFGCGKSGDIIDLYKELKQVETGKAIKELAERAGLLPQGTYNAPQQRTRGVYTLNGQFGTQEKKPATRENKEQYSKVYEEFIWYCEGLDEESRNYLKSEQRGLTDETIANFLLCSVGDYTKIAQKLKSKFDIEELKGAGLCNEEGNLIFYKHKIIIPFIEKGRVVYLRGRYLNNGSSKADVKMLGLKGRQTMLYNAETLKGLKKGDRVFICEGEFDAMILEQHGYRAVAVVGVNNFKPEMTELFKGFEVVLAFDNDEAGQAGALKVAKLFEGIGQAVKIKKLPEEIKDITDYFIKKK